MRSALRAPVLAAAMGLLAGGWVLLPAAPAAAEDPSCAEVQVDTPASAEAPSSSLPVAALRIQETHDLLRQRGIPLGRGVRVAVLDSGVSPAAPMRVDRQPSATGVSEILDWHGTAVAGLIAAPYRDGEPVGIAPEAEIVDVRVYDTPTPSNAGEEGVSAGRLADGLRRVLALGDVDIVNVSLRIPANAEVEALVERLWERGTVVVAAAGNRPDAQETEDEEFARFAEPRAGQDAAGVVFPAGYDRVVAVSATTDGLPGGRSAAEYVLPNSRTDVAAPTHGAVSVGLNGGPCLLTDPFTSWSAAQVSGVLALLAAAYDEEPAQLVARLLDTADGRTDVRSLYTGAGVVQPLEALRRPLTPDPDGELPRTTVERRDERAVAPDLGTDPLDGVDDDALWWGLLGGGALVVAVVLRPVLARRARRDG